MSKSKKNTASAATATPAVAKRGRRPAIGTLVKKIEKFRRKLEKMEPMRIELQNLEEQLASLVKKPENLNAPIDERKRELEALQSFVK